MFGRQHATQDSVHVISFPTIQVQSLARRDICWYVFPWRVHKCGITGTIARDDQVHTNCKKRRLALIHSLSAQSSAGSGNIGRKRACSSTSNGQSRRTMRWRSCRRPSSSQTWMELLRHRLGWNVTALWLVAFVVPRCSLARCHRREGWKVEHWHSAEWSRHISAPSHLAPLSSSWNAGYRKA